MFRHILVPLDGSLRAERALPIALRIARASEGMLILLRTIKTAPENGQGAHLFHAAIQSQREEAQQYLSGIAASPQLAGLPIIISTQQGSVVATIQAAINTYQADLLVCCDQPEAQNEQQTLGSFAEQLSQSISIPLLLLPAQEPLHRSLAELYQPLTCVIAFTGSQPEPYLIQPAVSFLVALGGHDPGHLHFAPLHSLLSRIDRMQPEQTTTALSHSPSHVSQPGSTLLKEGRIREKTEDESEQERANVFVLAMPLPREEGTVLREMRVYPRLLVPAPGRK